MAEFVATTSGKVRGIRTDGVSAFLGIPYAGPAVGPALFAHPGPAPTWDGVRDAVDYGATPPKPGYPPPYDSLLIDPVVPGDEFLNVNVWTPDPGGAGLPVMVWIHGGAFRNGCNAVRTYDGSAFARDGVVLVGVNYRLGAAGFAVLPDAPANLGLHDQLAALAWVQENIAAFGGDPGNVTIFGESAGAMSVTTLVAVAAGSGLFRKAIAQSGAGHSVVTAEDARRVSAALGRQLGVEPTAAALSEVGVDRLIDAQREVANQLAAHPKPDEWGPSVVAAGMAFMPVVDGDLITERPIDAIAAGVGHDVTMMTGTTSEEWRFFLGPPGIIDATTDDMLAGTIARRGWRPEVAEVYRANRPAASAGDLLCALITDQYFRVPAVRLAEARFGAPTPTYCYEFTWGTPVGNLGSCHALELGFVFDTIDDPATAHLVGDEPPRDLAEDMHGRWVEFARHGDPGWAPYEPARRAVMAFGSPSSHIVENPRADELALWDGIV